MKRIILSALFFLSCSVYMTAQSGRSGIIGKFSPYNQIGSGVNIHFVTGGEKELDMIAAAGFKFIRMDFEWQSIERTKGTYNWAAYDELTANLEKRGLGALYILDYSNSLYEESYASKDTITGREQKGTSSPQHTESIAAFARWAAAAAGHFKGRNIIWEIWNEPNITNFWKPKANVEQYIALAMATSKAIRAVVPDAVIVSGGTSHVTFPFLGALLASGVLEYLDAVSVHPYREGLMSPETAIYDYQKLRGLIDIYTPAGKKNIPIINSEWGYSSNDVDVPLELHAAYAVRMQLADLINNIPLSVWYDWKSLGNGLVTPDLKPKPAYTAIQTMNMQLKGFTFLNRIELNSDNDYVLLFKNDKGDYKVSAWTMDQVHSVVIDKIMPKINGATAIDGIGNVLKLKTEQGWLVLDLNELPQYITLPTGIRIK
jgi:hypothetical protein